MLKTIRDTFNNNFGSNTTYIANAYRDPKGDYVLVCFAIESLDIQSFKVKLDASMDSSGHLRPSVSVEAIWVSTMHGELFRIPHGDVHKKERRTNIAYITVITADGIMLAQNMEIAANRSIIITSRGAIKRQKYGGDLWTDEDERDHRP